MREAFALRAGGQDVRAPSHSVVKFGWHSRGYLPHFDGGSIPQSITFRLADSLPKPVLEQWAHELESQSAELMDTEMQKRIAAYLDEGHGSCHLKHPEVASLVQNSLLFFDKEKYLLLAWVVMPNHVHLVATPLPGKSLAKIVHSLKSYTANEANKILKRKGSFWMSDYFDRYIRNERHFASAAAYIENNPVKARLCRRPEDWPFSSAWFRAHEEW